MFKNHLYIRFSLFTRLPRSICSYIYNHHRHNLTKQYRYETKILTYFHGDKKYLKKIHYFLYLTSLFGMRNIVSVILYHTKIIRSATVLLLSNKLFFKIQTLEYAFI